MLESKQGASNGPISQMKKLRLREAEACTGSKARVEISVSQVWAKALSANPLGSKG